MAFRKPIIFFLILLFSAMDLIADDIEENTYIEQDWALGAILRYATIPFASEDRTVGSFVPMMFFEGERFFIRGIEGGYKIHRGDTWQISAISRMRFFDFPKDYQNLLSADNVLWGAQFRYQPFPLSFTDIEILSDIEGHVLSNVRLGFLKDTKDFHIEAFVKAQLKTASFNNYYYGLTVEDVGAGIDLSVGIIADYHVVSNLYLFGAAELTLLDRQVRNSPLINRDVNAQAFFGFGFSNDRDKVGKSILKNKAFIRVSHGWSTPDDLSKIIRFQSKPDTNNNQISTIFYGHPLTDDLFGLPLDFYIMSGLGYHWPIKQKFSLEAVVAIKLFYTFSWPIRWKLGAAEGMSYVNRIPYVEQAEMDKNEYRPSNLMNYLGFSLDFNIGDIFGGDQLKRFWLGYNIHHRSSIFETAQQFGRIKGGSNFQMIHIQWDF